ncbi:MAG: S8 family peptidase [Pseudomonadota bacterium]
MHPLRYAEDFFAKFDQVAARISSSAAQDIFEIGSRVAFLLVILVLMSPEVKAQPRSTYPGIILSTNGTTVRQAALQETVATSKIAGLASEPLSNGAVLVRERALAALADGPIFGRRNLCRTARVRVMMRRARGFIRCDQNFEVLVDRVPNDPGYSSTMWGLESIGAAAAWDITTGTNDAIVAVIDTGIFNAHPDLKANLWINPGEVLGNQRDDDVNGYVDDYHGANAITRVGSGSDDNGHGTHVAGTIGATGDNALGVVGVNWNVRLMSVKFLSSSGSGSTANAIRSVEYVTAAKKKGHNIVAINASWGGPGFSQALFDSIKRAGDAGILFVAAAGNDARNNDISPSYPASYQLANVISVASIDSSGSLSYFSNYGARTVHIAAPGGRIYSTTLPASYGTLSGTSMACPHVAGIAALTHAACPRSSMLEIKDMILNNGSRRESLRSKLVTEASASAVGAVSVANSVCAQLQPSPSATPSLTPTPTATQPPEGQPTAPPGTPTPTATSAPTDTATPTPTTTPTPTHTPTTIPSPLPTTGYLFAEPSRFPVGTKTTLNISAGRTAATVVSLKYVLYSANRRPYRCAGATIVSLPKGSRAITWDLPKEGRHFPMIDISFEVLKSKSSTQTFSTTVFQTDTVVSEVPTVMAERTCRYLTSASKWLR